MGISKDGIILVFKELKRLKYYISDYTKEFTNKQLYTVTGAHISLTNGSHVCPALPSWKGFPGGSDGIESACSTGEPGSFPGLGRSPGVGNGNALQYAHLENFMDRGAQWAAVHWVTKSQTWLSD